MEVISLIFVIVVFTGSILTAIRTGEILRELKIIKQKLGIEEDRKD